MDKIEEIANQRKTWKAARKQAEKDGNAELSNHYSDLLIGMSAALKIIGWPPNTQLKLDAQETNKCTCSPDCMCSFCLGQKFYQGTT